MPDISHEMLPAIQSHRLPGLDLGAEWIYPNYQGRSILNLPASICRIFGLPGIGAPALDDRYLAAIQGDDQLEIRKVVVILMDALALQRLQQWIVNGLAPVWGELAEAGVLAPLTSIVPSTTSAALTSIWTGQSPSVHGITGYEMWVKEYGMVVNTILHNPASYRDGLGSLTSAGFSPGDFLPLPTLGAHLANYGVQSYAHQHYSIIDSGLSQMFFKDVQVCGVVNATDLWINLRELFEEHAQERLYSWVYWGEVDTFSHRYGPDDERPAAEFASFSAAMQRLFLDRLSPRARQGTLLILTGDHGQITTPIDPYYDLSNHPNLTRRLHIIPSGENRLAYLHIRPGQTEAVREYLDRTWPNQFLVLESVYAAESGLFGPGEQHPDLLNRIGDYIVLSRGRAYLWWANKRNRMLGRHGGLHPSEMLVPFLATRL
jgi:hypothetical protein